MSGQRNSLRLITLAGFPGVGGATPNPDMQTKFIIVLLHIISLPPFHNSRIWGKGPAAEIQFAWEKSSRRTNRSRTSQRGRSSSRKNYQGLVE